MKKDKKQADSDVSTYSPFSIAMGERVAQAREAYRKNGKKITQRQMADLLGVSVDTYRMYENGRTPMRPHLLVKFCLLTGYSPWHYYTGRPSFEADFKNR